MDEFYKEDEDITFQGRGQNQIKIPEIEQEIIDNEPKFFEYFDSLFENLNTAMLSSDFEAVNIFVDKLIPLFGDIFLRIYEHVIHETSLLSETITYIITYENEFVPPLLKLLAAFCSSPDNKTSQHLLNFEGFVDRLRYFLMESDNPFIFTSAFRLLSEIYRECLAIDYPLEIDINEDLFARPLFDFPQMAAENLDVYSIFLHYAKEATTRNFIVLFSTDLIKSLKDITNVNLDSILNTYRNCIKKDSECFDLMNQNETKFLETTLIDIIAPFRDYKNQIMIDNAVAALKLLSSIIKKFDSEKEYDSNRHQQCNNILSSMNWLFVLKNINKRPPAYIESVFKLLSHAYPTRSWLRQTVKENGIFHLFPDLLQESHFKTRLAVLKFINTLIQYNLTSSNLEDFDLFLCNEFVELLVNSVQNMKWNFVLEVFKAIKNLCDLSMQMYQPQIVTDFKCEELSDVFDTIEEESQDIPLEYRDKLLNYIPILKEQIDMICDNCE